MRKILKRTLCLLLVCLMVAAILSGCSSSGRTIAQYEDVKISENMYMLLLSRLKGNLSSADNYSTSALYDSFWDTVVSSDGTTRDEFYKKEVLDDVKFYAAALYMFDELGLTLPESYEDEIEKELQELIDGDADGSRTTFNTILSAYGANYNVLKDAYVMEAKISYLSKYLFGEGGSKVGEQLIEDYYQENYFRFKHIFLYTYALVYEEDEDGNEIYYIADTNGRISYDVNAMKRRDENGAEVKDKNGDIVYENADGTIAYDKANGQRQPVYDEKGYVLTREFTRDELIEVNDRATLIMEKLDGAEGNYTMFDSFVESYSEDEGSITYKEGFYMTAESNYDSPEVLEALPEMEEGEIRRVNSKYGIHIVMKYELDEGGYAREENSDFFISTATGSYSFMSKLVSGLLVDYLAPHTERVSVDEEIYSSISIKSIRENYNY